MTPNTTNLVFKNLVIEPSLEFTLSLRGSSDISGLLTTSEDNKVLLGSESGGVEGGVSDESFENFKVVYVHNLYFEGNYVSVENSLGVPRGPILTLALLSLEAVTK